MKRVAIWIGSAVALALAPTSAGAGPLEECWQSKLSAVADLSKAYGDCSRVAAKFGNAQACQDEARDEFETRWLDASADPACEDAATAQEMDTLVQWILFDTMNTIGLGLPPFQTVRDLSSKLTKASADYAARLLDAESQNLQVPDPDALAAALKKSRKKFAKQWKKAVKRAKKRGFKFKTKYKPTAKIVQVQAEHLVTVAMTGEPAPPPEGDLVDTNDGIRVEAVRVGDDLEIEWEPSKKVAKKALFFELQEWTGFRWNTVATVSNSPTPWATLPNAGFCLRIMAVKSPNKPFASGMSGDAPPCSP